MLQIFLWLERCCSKTVGSTVLGVYPKNASACCCYHILSFDVLNTASILYEREKTETGKYPTQVPVFGFPGLKDDGAFLEKEDIRRWCLSAS